MNQKMILLVEDEAPIARALSQALQDKNFQVQTVVTAQLARETLLSADFDLIILDLLLPDANGLSLLADLHQIKPSLPVMILSNVSMRESMEEAKKFGVCDYVVKAEISLKEVVQKVIEVLESGRCSQPFNSTGQSTTVQPVKVS